MKTSAFRLAAALAAGLVLSACGGAQSTTNRSVSSKRL